LVAFDKCPYTSFGPAAASMKPGAICCSQGHNHIYFPRDFGFLSSAVTISEAVMRENREAYLAVNRPGQGPSRDSNPEAVEPEASPEAEVPASRSARYAPDSRREAAGKAAKERWASWADNKKCCMA
jgi:hypothetical protein